MQTGKEICLADLFQKRAEFRLENDENRKNSPVQEYIRKVLHRFKAKKTGTHIKQDKHHNALENLYRSRVVTDNPQYIVQDEPYDKDICRRLQNSTKRQYR